MPAEAAQRPLALVTGAGGGIGRALVAGFMAHGFDVLAAVRAPLATPLPPAPAGARCDSVAADLATDAGRRAVVDAVRAQRGVLRCLVNGAGVGMSAVRRDYYKRPLVPAEVDAAMLARFMAVNAQAPLALAIALLPQLRGGGRIINIGTSLTAMLRQGFLPYAMSKAALEAGSAVLSRDLEHSGITVHLVHPGGPVDTPMAPRDEPALRAALLPSDSMTAAICWLAGDGGAAHHGQRLNTRLWRGDDPHAGFTPIGWPQLADDSAWGVRAATDQA